MLFFLFCFLILSFRCFSLLFTLCCWTKILSICKFITKKKKKCCKCYYCFFLHLMIMILLLLLGNKHWNMTSDCFNFFSNFMVTGSVTPCVIWFFFWFCFNSTSHVRLAARKPVIWSSYSLFFYSNKNNNNFEKCFVVNAFYFWLNMFFWRVFVFWLLITFRTIFRF